MKGGRRRIDKVLDEDYLAGLTEIGIADLREKRTEAAEEEALLSYERRLLHGRLDILRAEQERRRTGGGDEPVEERLKRILGGESHSSRGAFPVDMPLPSFDNPRRRVEKLVSDDTLANLPDLSDERIEEIIAAIVETESDVSDDRRRVQDVLDALTGEIARRYKTGEANPADVLSRDA